ncbi:MAG: asparagine synthase (glutamine-hydrolyzing) [Mariprofundaceae bacterium]
MCGIAGFIGRALPRDAKSILWRMAEKLHHRGPDSHGIWLDAVCGVGLAHRRLSIIDLSREGHQPMASASGRYHIVFNGEIYNFHLLRRELEDAGQRFHGHSDTEVMLAAFDAWGLDEALKRFTGMFAFALWDSEARTLHLARDRLGEKPLYYGWVDQKFVFASELKALRAMPGWQGDIDRGSLALFMRLAYVPAPYSIYQGVYKLLPGNVLSITDMLHPGERPVPREYWSAGEVVAAAQADQFSCGGQEAVAMLDGLLRDAVAKMMVADVPLGAFLSGGIDSSAVVALMQVQSGRPVKTFTIGLHDEAYNEARHAKAVADHLGTDHTELFVTPEETMGVISRLPAIYDEPFADVSQIPTFLVAQMAREHVTVALSGDGGDELFGGYNRHYWAAAAWKRAVGLPGPVRAGLAGAIRAVSPVAWNALYSRLEPLLPVRWRARLAGEKLYKFAQLLQADSRAALYRGLVSQWFDPAQVVLGANEPATVLSDEDSWPAGMDFSEQMMFQDMTGYLPGDILTKVDRASMAVSLETRIPLLDHRVVEFAWRLPLDMKIRDGQGKWLLRQMLYQYVPRELVERPKMGFGVPIDVWLRGPLRDWAESLLDEQRLRQQGFFNVELIHRRWHEHLRAKRNWQYPLWCVLMFQAWLDEA